jgi:hypothetical protein
MNNTSDSYVQCARRLRKDHGQDASLVRAVDGVGLGSRPVRRSRSWAPPRERDGRLCRGGRARAPARGPPPDGG